MMPFTSAFFALLGETMAVLGENGFPGALAELLQHAGGYESTVVAAFPANGRPLRLFSNLSPPEEAATTLPYFNNAYLLDPWYNMANDHAVDGVYRLADCVPDDFLESDYYQGYYLNTGLTDECGIFIRLNDSLCVVIMLGIRRGTATGRIEGLLSFFPCIQAMVTKQWRGLTTLSVAPIENLEALCQGKGLTKREAQVTSHLLRGYSNKLIAREIGISPETVKIYRKRINTKLGTSSAREIFVHFFNR